MRGWPTELLGDAVCPLDHRERITYRKCGVGWMFFGVGCDACRLRPYPVPPPRPSGKFLVIWLLHHVLKREDAKAAILERVIASRLDGPMPLPEERIDLAAWAKWSDEHKCWRSFEPRDVEQ